MSGYVDVADSEFLVWYFVCQGLVMAFATKQSLNGLAARVRILEQNAKRVQSPTSGNLAEDLVSKVIAASTALHSLLDAIAGHHSHSIGSALRQDFVQKTLGSTLHGKVGRIAKAANILRHVTAFAVDDTLAKVRAFANTSSGEAPREDVAMVPSAAAVAERPCATYVDLPKVSVDLPKAAQPEHDSGNKVLKRDVSGAMKPVEQTSRHAGSIPGSDAADSGTFAGAIFALQALASQASTSFSEATHAKPRQRGLFDVPSSGT